MEKPKPSIPGPNAESEGELVGTCNLSEHCLARQIMTIAFMSYAHHHEACARCSAQLQQPMT